MIQTDVLIIGNGIAGSLLAYELAKAGREVMIVTSAPEYFKTNSARAQGGIICQSEKELKDDLLKVGSGLCYPRAVEQLLKLGPQYFQKILINEIKVPFERDSKGNLCLAKEAAHTHPRIAYHGDQTGKAIMEALFDQLKTFAHVTFKYSHYAVDLITLSHHSKSAVDLYQAPTCVGAYVLDSKRQKVDTYFAKETVIATGGIGEVYLHTTNSSQARGDGIAMAYRAGVRIMNMEYVQFHPTALYLPGKPRFLLSEALRGEGGCLLNRDLKPFMDAVHPQGNLAPRDIVSRAIFHEMIRTDCDHLWLDVSFLEKDWLKKRFTHIHKQASLAGFDFTKEPLPIVPAAHYMCGGIAVDLVGKTTMHRLRALGEVSCTGVHGANRLASASLLESMVWGITCAHDLTENWSTRKDYFPLVEQWVMGKDQIDLALIQQDWMTIKQTMWNYVGLIRGTDRLKRGYKMLTELKWEVESFYADGKLTPELLGLRNGLETALLITQGAMKNPASKGCHYRE